MEKHKEALKHCSSCKPDFIELHVWHQQDSDTGRNMKMSQAIKEDSHAPVLTHFTCISNSKEKIDSELENYLALDIKNILAVRSDLPEGWEGTPGDFNHADRLIRYIRTKFPGLLHLRGLLSREAHPRSVLRGRHRSPAQQAGQRSRVPHVAVVPSTSKPSRPSSMAWERTGMTSPVVVSGIMRRRGCQRTPSSA